ncbi:helix-turn-helix domain-containing protein [Streptomyces sp. SCSIO 30461]|uniref:helix-turn-helix domain-containing protein n=1 Tax=Streptomyces sp. SCSIO 30461 TaxID=3118085 RepID=UPI0030D1E2CC
MLLPVSGLSRRADVVEVIGAALEMKASGAGHRRIADLLGRPRSTVRGWLRRFAARAGAVAGFFTSHLVALADDPSVVLPAPAVSVFADAVAAVIAAAMAVRGRFPVVTAPVWRVASAVSRGSLLAPSWPLPTS